MYLELRCATIREHREEGASKTLKIKDPVSSVCVCVCVGKRESEFENREIERGRKIGRCVQ